MMKKGMGIYVIVFTLAFLCPSVVAAEEGQKEKPWERFSLNLGGFVTTLNSDFRIGSQSLGVGVAYDYFRLQFKAEGNDYPGLDMVGKLQFNYGGILLYGKLFF